MSDLISVEATTELATESEVGAALCRLLQACRALPAEQFSGQAIDSMSAQLADVLEKHLRRLVKNREMPSYPPSLELLPGMTRFKTIGELLTGINGSFGNDWSVKGHLLVHVLEHFKILRQEASPDYQQLSETAQRFEEIVAHFLEREVYLYNYNYVQQLVYA